MRTKEAKFPFNMYRAQGEDRIIYPRMNDRAMEICEVTSGTVLVQVGTEFVEASVGDFVYVPPTMMFGVSAIDGTASVRGMVFDTAILEANMDKFDTEILYMFRVQSKSRAAVFKEGHPVHTTLAVYMEQSYEEYSTKDVCYMLPIRANIYLMMTALLRFYCGSKDELDRMLYHNVLRLRPVIDYISINFKEKIYVDKLATMLNVSPDYFTKMFKDSIGKTPIDYINGMRINCALSHLSNTDMSMADIAEDVGFCNANYFHKIFKQYMVTSPLAYRKSCKQ